MTIMFRIRDTHDTFAVPPATINRDQLADLLDYLAIQSTRLGLTLVHDEDGTTADFGFSFEMRVRPLALASLTAIFDHDRHVIAVIDEAQYLGRRVRVRREENIGLIRIEVAFTRDVESLLRLPDRNAYALLEGLGIDAGPSGEIPLAELRSRLTDPTIHRRLGDDPMLAGHLPSLAAMARNPDPAFEGRLTWA